MKRLFLEDLADPIKTTSLTGQQIFIIENLSSIDGYKHLCLPEKIYVCHYPEKFSNGKKLLADRFIAGQEKHDLTQEVTHNNLRAMNFLFPSLFNQSKSQFIILWSALPMNLLEAKPKIFEDKINTSLLRIKRYPIYEKNSEEIKDFYAKIEQMIGMWWKTPIWIFLNECDATGASTGEAINVGLDNYCPKKIITFSLCCSMESISRVNEIIRKKCPPNKQIEYIPIVHEALIELNPKNKTDLGMRKKTIISCDFYNELYEVYQNTDSCFVLDYGKAIFYPEIHWLKCLKDMKDKKYILKNITINTKIVEKLKSPEFKKIILEGTTYTDTTGQEVFVPPDKETYDYFQPLFWQK